MNRISADELIELTPNYIKTMEFWDGISTLYPPGTDSAHPEDSIWTKQVINRKFPWTNIPGAKAVMNLGAPAVSSFTNLSVLCNNAANDGLDFPETATDEFLLELVDRWAQKPPPEPIEDPAIDAMNRNTAALEFQNMMMD